jgi:hypothetical protein
METVAHQAENGLDVRLRYPVVVESSASTTGTETIGLQQEEEKYEVFHNSVDAQSSEDSIGPQTIGFPLWITQTQDDR